MCTKCICNKEVCYYYGNDGTCSKCTPLHWTFWLWLGAFTFLVILYFVGPSIVPITFLLSILNLYILNLTGSLVTITYSVAIAITLISAVCFFQNVVNSKHSLVSPIGVIKNIYQLSTNFKHYKCIIKLQNC